MNDNQVEEIREYILSDKYIQLAIESYTKKVFFWCRGVCSMNKEEIRKKADDILENLSDLNNQEKFEVLIVAIAIGIPVCEEEE